MTISNQGIIDIDSGRLVTNSLNVSTNGQMKIENGGPFIAHGTATAPVTISAAAGPNNASVLVTGARLGVSHRRDASCRQQREWNSHPKIREAYVARTATSESPLGRSETFRLRARIPNGTSMASYTSAATRAAPVELGKLPLPITPASR